MAVRKQANPETGYLVLADISGFTSFLSTSELDHAHDILDSLLQVVVDCLAPPFTVLTVEGDAVFACARENKIDRGEFLLELFEMTYTAFRDRIETIRRHTTCRCAACTSVPSLDLKFISHFGTYVARDMAGSYTLIGSDVNLVHRLLKNHVSEETGWHAYTLLTESAIQRLGVSPASMRKIDEEYEHLGTTPTYCLDMLPRYEEIVDGRHTVLEREDAMIVSEVELPAPASVVWDWLNDPQKRERWWWAQIQPISRPGDRLGMGAVNHCTHGKDSCLETVVGWRPFDYLTTDLIGHPFNMLCRIMWLLTPADAGTRLELRSMVKLGPGIVGRTMSKTLHKKLLQPSLDRLVDAFEREKAAPVESVGH
jgi:class 3 adenylate cyclase